MKTYEEYVEEEEKNLEDTKKKKQDTINQGYDEQEKNTKDIYNTAVKNTEIKYESDYERNAVQKLINERAIAEKNANLGLTDSGLNRTQQTAVQMSYANQKGALDIAKQGALDELTQNLALSLSDIESKRAIDLANLEANIEAQAQNNAANRYNADVAASVARYTGSSGGGSYSGDNSKIYKIEHGTLAGTTYGSNGNIIYIDIYGNEVEMRAGSNPFTNTIHPDARDESGKFDASKVFSNGYQPNNINGKALFVEMPEHKNVYKINNQTQNVWKCNGKYWVWDGVNNEYFEVKKRYLNSNRTSYIWEEVQR